MIEEHSIPVEHSVEEVCSAASTTIDSIRSLPRFDALKVMAKGAISIALSYQDQGLLRGVIGVGGSTSTALVSEIMRALKIGLPKLIVRCVFMDVSAWHAQKYSAPYSTMASGDVSGYIGDSDITIMPSIGMHCSIRNALSSSMAHEISHSGYIWKAQRYLDSNPSKCVGRNGRHGVLLPCP
jgi:uncharacterized protein (UPF0261 family)